jgi:hypothetical protein
MKPTTPIIESEHERAEHSQFPVTDFHYHAPTLAGYNGHCAKAISPSFRSISRDYFNTEAQRYLLAEAFVFTVIMLTAALPLLNGARAVLNLVSTRAGV